MVTKWGISKHRAARVDRPAPMEHKVRHRDLEDRERCMRALAAPIPFARKENRERGSGERGTHWSGSGTHWSGSRTRGRGSRTRGLR